MSASRPSPPAGRRVQAVVLDWSGTTVDAYVVAPTVTFVEVFRRRGVEISMEEARGPMGLRKDLHIQALTETPAIARRWESTLGAPPTDADVAAMFAEFVPLQLACLRDYATLLPGVADVVRRLQARGVKIGSTTGFTRAMADVLEEEAAKQGYRPDASVAGDEVIHGARPAPHMLYRNLDLLGVSDIRTVVKVDDTASGIGEAQNGGCWGVGVARFSNYMNVDTPEQGSSMPQAETERRLARSRSTLREAGAHYVIDSLAEIEPVIDDIDARLERGERP